MASCRRCSTPAICCHRLYSCSACASPAEIAFFDASISVGVLPFGFCFWAFSYALRFSSAMVSAISLAVAASPSANSTRASQPCSGFSACSKIGSPFASRGRRCRGVGSAVGAGVSCTFSTGVAGLGTVSAGETAFSVGFWGVSPEVGTVSPVLGTVSNAWSF